MALNKYMHPRNIYKTPPDFANLAKLYTEFSAVTKLDATGKVTIDFKDPNSLRTLTKSLLKHDFNLDVDIPDNRLVPTLPLRLNYVLWLEDLLTSVQRETDVHGLDIGTGACAIYPLLAAVKNKWRMVGTETDAESIVKAEENIQNNNLQHLIKLKKNTTNSIIDHLFSDESKPHFDFCMCNPPFYSNIQELCESRSPARLPPKNGFTGSPQELITEGGELEFCRKLIKESKLYKDNVLIFTTMIGHKYNLNVLIQDLKADDIKHTHTEFCQGRVTRWGLAWTYGNYDIYNLVPPRDKQRKKITPSVYLLPELPNIKYNVEAAFDKVKGVLNNLSINYKVVEKRGNNISLDITANSNTWSNQRRKRRLMKRMETEAKKSKLDTEDASPAQCIETINASEFPIERRIIGEESNVRLNPTKDTSPVQCSETINASEDPIERRIIGEESNVRLNPTKDTSPVQCSEKINAPEVPIERMGVNDEGLNLNKDTTENTESPTNYTNHEIVVHAFLKMSKKDKDVLLEMDFLDGSAGKEGLHQVAQYIKNNWK